MIDRLPSACGFLLLLNHFSVRTYYVIAFRLFNDSMKEQLYLVTLKISSQHLLLVPTAGIGVCNIGRIFQVDTLFDSVNWDDKGLAVAINQNVDTGAILMQGFVNRDVVGTTISSRNATFCSWSWLTLWTMGELEQFHQHS